MSLVILLCVLFLCRIFAPAEVDLWMAEGGWILKFALVFAGAWAGYWDLGTRRRAAR